MAEQTPVEEIEPTTPLPLCSENARSAQRHVRKIRMNPFSFFIPNRTTRETNHEKESRRVATRPRRPASMPKRFGEWIRRPEALIAAPWTPGRPLSVPIVKSTTNPKIGPWHASGYGCCLFLFKNYNKIQKRRVLGECMSGVWST